MTTQQGPAWERFASRAFSKMGLTVMRSSSVGRRLPIEATSEDRVIIDRVRPFTMTSDERIWALLRSIRYLIDNAVPGDIVECGVWRGGSMMAAALQLQALGATDRTLWLYDTYTGMTPPTAEDREAVSGTPAQELLDSTEAGDGNNVWCIADEADVRRNMDSSGYPPERLRFIKGDVAITLAESFPQQIALLRLDTDWYASTKSELEHLYHRLVPGGICILDDYGHWQGARQAVDEFFEMNNARPLMVPIDFSGRLFVKPC